MTAAPFAEVFTLALRGAPCTVVGLHDQDALLPVTGWLRAADASDRELLTWCVGATIDVGCGPGRMSSELTGLGHLTLGIDIVPEAVDQARARGVVALRRNVFDPLPGEGRWQTALLADGNIGIGGDPVALLRRLRALLAPGGRVVADLAAPGTGLRHRVAHLRCDQTTSSTFPWSLVGPESLPGLAAAAGFTVLTVRQSRTRCFGVLSR